MTTFTARRFAALVGVSVLYLSNGAGAQDLSRYRGVVFGSSVSAVVTITGANASGVTLIHQRPALIQELTWRPQYSVNRPPGRSESVREVLFRFHDDELFRVTVVYDARLVEGLTNVDVIDAVSAVYGPATLLHSASPPVPPSSVVGATTALARWQSPDYEFTLTRDVYPATFRLVGVARRLDTVARAAETEAMRLDKEEAPRRDAEAAAVNAARRKADEEKARATNKGDFRP
jgi:hypothetical protein